MSTESDLLRELPDTPAGAQARFHLGRLLSAGEGSSPADLARYVPELAKRLNFGATADEIKANWRGFAERMGALERVSIDRSSDYQLSVLVETAKGRRWLFIISVEEHQPHRIAHAEWQRQFDFKIDVRQAAPDDAPILAEIERRCPIVLGDTSIYFDRGNDYFAFTRLMEEYAIGVASVDGVPAAVSCGVLRTVRIGGSDRRIVTVLHLRVLPEHQRKGLWGAANSALRHLFDRADGSNAYIAVNNAGMQHGFINTPSKWPTTVVRAQLDCAALAGAASGRPATPSDAQSMVEMLNAFHGGEEMYVPHSVVSFGERMSRARELYSWGNILMTDKAMLGVWPAESLTVVSESGGRRTESRRAVALDYAFEPGAADDFRALVAVWCSTLKSRGIDTLSIYTSPNSPGCAEVTAIAREAEPFNMWSPGIAVPEGAARRGLYTDPIYF